MIGPIFKAEFKKIGNLLLNVDFLFIFLPYFSSFLILYVIESPVAQANLKLAMQQRMAFEVLLLLWNVTMTRQRCVTFVYTIFV